MKRTALLSLAAALVFASCMSQAPERIVGGKRLGGTGRPVASMVYIEVNRNNPLNAASYQLEDGTNLFDYAVIFAANLRMRDCSLETGEPHGCTKKGPHVHLNENVRHVLENRNKYIKPLQDKGIKVLLSLLGDHDGIGFGTMTSDQISVFVDDVKATVEQYGLDGVDFDDEYAGRENWDTEVQENNPTPESMWVYPESNWWWPFRLTIYRNPALGIGPEGVQPGNGTLTAPDKQTLEVMWRAGSQPFYDLIAATRRALGRDKIITVYEINHAEYISRPADPETGLPATPVTTAQLEAAVDHFVQPYYGQYRAESPNGISHSKYAPFGMDIGTAAPPVSIDGDENAENSLASYSQRFVDAGDYGFIYFYDLQQASNLLPYNKGDETGSITAAEYLSRMAQIVFGQKVVITADGGDYSKDW